LPDTWHHVINRGIAKRPLFETRDDIRFFLERLARQNRLNRIEVHAYCMMTTHFHLLVRSPIGEPSKAMRRVQNEHTRRFNRDWITSEVRSASGDEQLTAANYRAMFEVRDPERLDDISDVLRR
jgi:REP element-mobilizing transposase RayT